MNLQFFLEKLKHSDAFKEFIEKDKGAYFCSGFFTIDLEGSDNQKHLDYYSPIEKKIIGFRLDSGVEKIVSEPRFDPGADFGAPSEISDDVDFEFKDLQDAIDSEIEKRDLKTKISKILLSLQVVEGKVVLVCTVFVSRFGLLKVNVELPEMKIISFEKKSIFDLISMDKKK